MQQNSDANQMVRGTSPNFSDDHNSENTKATLPIDEQPSTVHFNVNQSMVNNTRQNSERNLYDDMSGLTGNKQQQQQQPQQYPIIGHNSFAFWTLVSIIFVLTVGNLILTMTILGVLRLGKGMEFMELVPEAKTVEFFGITDLDRIYKRDGVLEGFADVPMSITGDNGNAQILLVKGNGHIHNKMLMSKNGTTFHGVNHVEVKHRHNGENIFTTHKPHFNLPHGVDNLQAKILSTSRITAPVDENLSLNNTRNGGRIVFRGSEGVQMKAKEIFMAVDQNLHFRTHNGSIVLEGLNGVYIDVKSIPIVGEHGIKIENKQYKICVCMPQGKLFRVAVAPTSHIVKGICSHYNAKHDPCV